MHWTRELFSLSEEIVLEMIKKQIKCKNELIQKSQDM